MMNCTGETLDTLHVSMQAALSQAAWGRLAAIGKSRTVKWRQSSDQTGHSSHISDLCPRQSLPRPSVQIYNLESSSRLKMGAAIRRCFIQIRTLLYLTTFNLKPKKTMNNFLENSKQKYLLISFIKLLSSSHIAHRIIN